MKPVARTNNNVDPQRSAQMARVRGKDTGPELRVRRALHKAGLRYRLHDSRLPGRPDIVLRRRRIVIFVHGCFWHQHADPACKLSRMPKSRLDFWRPKLEANHARDRRHQEALEAQGWQVRIIWECQLRGEDALNRLIQECRAASLTSHR